MTTSTTTYRDAQEGGSLLLLSTSFTCSFRASSLSPWRITGLGRLITTGHCPLTPCLYACSLLSSLCTSSKSAYAPSPIDAPSRVRVNELIDYVPALFYQFIATLYILAYQPIGQSVLYTRGGQHVLARYRETHYDYCQPGGAIPLTVFAPIVSCCLLSYSIIYLATYCLLF